MRFLGLDIGERRIGVAVSDPLNITAQGLETIAQKDALDKISALVKEYDVAKIIVGLPLNMDGTRGPRAESVERFIEGIKNRISVVIEAMDERLTTVQGERVLLEADLSRKKRKASIDRISAQLILQTYLDSHVQKSGPK